MSKSILVIDTPECCIDCPCHFTSNYGMAKCWVRNEPLMENDIETFKPDWCPLKEMPRKKAEMEIKRNNDYAQNFYISGYNYCIDEILKDGD